MGGDQPPMPGGPPGGGAGGPEAGPGGIMMPNAPADLGPNPGNPGVPGGGPPVTAPITGPAGTVPEISNERRPGLTYNTSAIDWKSMDDASKAIENGMSPNWVGRQMRTAMINDGASEDQASNLVELWLNTVIGTVIEADLDTQKEDATLNESEVSEPEVPVGEWELNQGQELREAEGELPTRITRVGKKRDVKYKIDPSKKYSIVDPEAEPLIDGDNSESTESIGQGTLS
jgi:hypothetical protein